MTVPGNGPRLIFVVNYDWGWQVCYEFLVLPSWIGQLEALPTLAILETHTHIHILALGISCPGFHDENFHFCALIFVCRLVFCLCSCQHYNRHILTRGCSWTGIWVKFFTYILKYITARRMWSLLLQVWLLFLVYLVSENNPFFRF